MQNGFMKASIKLFTTLRETKKGFPICVELFHSNKNRRRKTIGYSKIEYWNDKEKKPFDEHPECYSLMGVLMTYKSKIYKVNYGQYSYKEAEHILFGDLDEKKYVDIGIIEFFNIRIEEKKARKESYRAYTGVKQVLQTYLGKDMPINNITYEWLNYFVLYKLKSGCNEGGVMSYLRTIRAVYKEAQRRTSLKVKQDNPFEGIIKSTNTKPVIQLSSDEFIKLRSFKPKKYTSKKAQQRIQQVIDIFIFQFLIGGHDYCDVALLTWENINKKRLQFQRYKLRNKKNGGPIIDNRLCEEALIIIEKHGSKNEERIFNFIPNPKTNAISYQYYRKNVNRTLKTISDGLKYKNAVKTKSPRYIFRTYAGELLIHDLIVMKLQGHKPQGVTFNYQGAISYKVIDESHEKILNCLQKQKEMC
jgi:hypothetical protein